MEALKTAQVDFAAEKKASSSELQQIDAEKNAIENEIQALEEVVTPSIEFLIATEERPVAEVEGQAAV